MKTTTMPGLKMRCPGCKKDVNVPMNCPKCGMQLSSEDAGRIASIQEGLKNSRANDVYYTVLAVAGAAIAVLVPFITRYVFHYLLDTFAWVLTAGGVALFVGSSVGVFVGNRKAKRLIKELESTGTKQAVTEP